jgi:hypothetical protein
VIYLALESAVVLPFTLVLLAAAIVAAVWVVVIRRLREAESGIALRWLLLAAATFLVALGSLLIGTPASGNDPSALCGATAADAASLPPDQTADISGESCRAAGQSQLQTAYGALALGVVIAVGTLVATRREPV